MKKVFAYMFFCFGLLQAQANRIVTIEGFSSPQAIAMTNLSAFVSNIGSDSSLAKMAMALLANLIRRGK